MECLHEDAHDGLRIIRLSGRMDIEGNDEIALRFQTLVVAGGPNVVVDLSGLDFIGSLGIGTLVTCAKNVVLRRGTLALYGAQPNVMSALVRTNVPIMIPTVATLDEARARVITADGR
jgi:anti-anti-sigma factor